MEKSIMEKMQDEASTPVMALIYEKVNELLGAGNQLFAMEFPARPLNMKNYEYTIDDVYTTVTKPYPVQEAEFMLSDQLFDVSPIVQGSNGEKLSTVYTTVINNLVPQLDTMRSFIEDQKDLRQWLLTKQVDEIDGTKREMTRMAMAKDLYGKFLEKRNAWYEEKNIEYDRRKAQNQLEEYCKWLSTTGLCKEEEINNFYNDAVVRGNYHEVLTILGFLNVSSPSEVLETTKQKMRASLRRSLDGASDIYPVQFQPSDWFKALKPNLSPKDLTMATDVLIREYRNKQGRMHRLQAQLSECAVLEMPVEQQAQLASEIEKCETALAKSEQDLMKAYGSGVVMAVKNVINIYKTYQNPAGEAKKALAAARDAKTKGEGLTPSQDGMLDILEDFAKEIVDSVLEGFNKQYDNMKALEQLNNARLALTESKVKDMRLQKMRIEEQIKNVQADLDFLSPLVSGVLEHKTKDDTPDGEAADQEVLTNPEEDAIDNSFMDVLISSEDVISMSDTMSKASTNQSGSTAGFWIGSYARRSSSSQASQEQTKVDMSKKIEIGFRIKKVSFERSGWFNPNIFKLSNNYYRLSDIKFSQGIHKDQVHKALADEGTEGLSKLVTYPDPKNAKCRLNYVLPAFPTGFVIAKDITIRVESTSEESKANKEYMESSSSRSGGCFGFRSSSSSSSRSTNESAYFGSTKNYFYIRIPGPQILGWFLEFTPPDGAQPYESLKEDVYKNQANPLNPGPSNAEVN